MGGAGTDLATRYLGLHLRSPLVASAGPLTERVESIQRLESAGAAAVVLPSLFEEQITTEALELDATLAAGAESFPEALTYFPEQLIYETTPDRYLALLDGAKAVIKVPVIASVNGSTPGGWTQYAGLLEDAGADALELNLYLVAADARASGTEVEERLLEMVRAVRQA